jgi:hypothetical protein
MDVSAEVAMRVVKWAQLRTLNGSNGRVRTQRQPLQVDEYKANNRTCQPPLLSIKTSWLAGVFCKILITKDLYVKSSAIKRIPFSQNGDCRVCDEVHRLNVMKIRREQRLFFRKPVARRGHGENSLRRFGDGGTSTGPFDCAQGKLFDSAAASLSRSIHFAPHEQTSAGRLRKKSWREQTFASGARSADTFSTTWRHEWNSCPSQTNEAGVFPQPARVIGRSVQPRSSHP